MTAVLYCVDHAAHEALVPATTVDDGRTRCTGHAGPAAAALTPRRRPPSCRSCVRTPHRAWFVVDDAPLCIRHAADAVFPDDDMRAHDMAHAAYLALHAAGVTGTY